MLDNRLRSRSCRAVQSLLASKDDKGGTTISVRYLTHVLYASVFEINTVSLFVGYLEPTRQHKVRSKPPSLTAGYCGELQEYLDMGVALKGTVGT